jgi:hypothetical protein
MPTRPGQPDDPIIGKVFFGIRRVGERSFEAVAFETASDGDELSEDPTPADETRGESS